MTPAQEEIKTKIITKLDLIKEGKIPTITQELYDGREETKMKCEKCKKEITHEAHSEVYNMEPFYCSEKCYGKREKMNSLVKKGLEMRYVCKKCLTENSLFKQADGTWTALYSDAVLSHSDQLKREE